MSILFKLYPNHKSKERLKKRFLKKFILLDLLDLKVSLQRKEVSAGTH